VDPTGAGDAFCGALAVAMADGRDWESALRFGAAAGSLSVRREGAIASLADRAAVEALASRST
jgi:ribokinase